MGPQVRIEVAGSPEAALAVHTVEGTVLLVNDLMGLEALHPQKVLPTH